MFASVWKMRSLVAATVALLMVQMMIDVGCVATTAQTETETQGGSSIFNFSGSPSLKSIVSTAIVSAAFYFLTSTKVGGEVVESNAKNTDIIDNYNVPIEANNYLGKKVDVVDDLYEDTGSSLIMDDKSSNAMGEYEAPGVEESAQWLDAGVEKFGNTVAGDNLPRNKRAAGTYSAKAANKKEKRCERKRERILKKFNKPIAKQVERNNSVLILSNSKGETMKESLKKMKEKNCENPPATYKGTVGGRGYLYPEYKFILNGMNTLREWVNSFNQNNAVSASAESEITPAEPSKSSRCKITGRKLAESVQSELLMALQNRKGSFLVDDFKKAGIIEKLEKIENSGCKAPFIVEEGGGADDEFTLRVNDLDYVNEWADKNGLPHLSEYHIQSSSI